jgi:hypothetical protein
MPNRHDFPSRVQAERADPSAAAAGLTSARSPEVLCGIPPHYGGNPSSKAPTYQVIRKHVVVSRCRVEHVKTIADAPFDV